ncbi:MAG TPA: hypothetical protein VLW17_10210 [Thermoanaerobaculaceae bacterium]|nr:hypothetical protein [Thermoanaerobaculaceae bacterium]
MGGNRVVRVVKFVVIGVLAVAVFGLLITLLWNWLTPSLFGWHTIGFWQALGLFLLARLLVGGFRGGPPRSPRSWRRRVIERWEKMTPEERERFRQGLREHWCPPGPEEAPQT